MEGQARKNIKPGDIFLCYLVKLGRWCGALTVKSLPYVDETPLFREVGDPYVVRFAVDPLVALNPEHSIPTALPEVWGCLSWTKNIERGSVGWGANFQRSLRVMPDNDAQFLLDLLLKQNTRLTVYPLSAKDQRNLRLLSQIKTSEGTELSVAIPGDVSDDEADEVEEGSSSETEARESHRIQAILAEIGAKMGFKVWIPRTDRERIKSLVTRDMWDKLVDVLPMNYNEATVRTIEQIDVLWLRGRSIARAFEVENSTAIYSGLLRMADLVALQPNIDIALHIVAPEDRSNAVLEQIRRPVFSLLDVGPLSERCTLLGYDSVREIAQLPHIQHLRDNVIDEYEIAATE
ncbi:MAG: hypothetical protein JOY52_01995 [Hyphomicrobiales bacterium]|nr:hypothetical protein [Hyphomicrobiales bacterium]